MRAQRSFNEAVCLLLFTVRTRRPFLRACVARLLEPVVGCENPTQPSEPDTPNAGASLNAERVLENCAKWEAVRVYESLQV